MKENNVKLTREELKQIRQKAALVLLRSGLATVGEVAPLRGVSRQALQKASAGPCPSTCAMRCLPPVR
jgi:O-succinylbenzoate synthase